MSELGSIGPWERLAMLEESIVRRVELRGQATYYILRDKNRDLISILANLDEKRRAKKIEQAQETYEECRFFLHHYEGIIEEGRFFLKEAVTADNDAETQEYTESLVIVGTWYNDWYNLFLSAKDIFDACWRLGSTVPISDFEKKGAEQQVPPLYALFDTFGVKMHKQAEAGVDAVEKGKKESEAEQPKSDRRDYPLKMAIERTTRKVRLAEPERAEAKEPAKKEETKNEQDGAGETSGTGAGPVP